jgi:hypothetical protein
MPSVPEVPAYTLRVRHPPQVTQRSTPFSRRKASQEDDDEGVKSGAQGF